MTDYHRILHAGIAVAVPLLLFLSMYHVNCTKSLRDRRDPDVPLSGTVGPPGERDEATWRLEFEVPDHVGWIHVYDRFEFTGDTRIELCYPDDEDDDLLEDLDAERASLAVCQIWNMTGDGPHRSTWQDGSDGGATGEQAAWFYEVRTEGTGSFAADLFLLESAPDLVAIAETWPCGVLY